MTAYLSAHRNAVLIAQVLALFVAIALGASMYFMWLAILIGLISATVAVFSGKLLNLVLAFATIWAPAIIAGQLTFAP